MLCPSYGQTLMMYNLDDEQLKDLLAGELDVMQLLDILGMSFREVIDMVFDSGLTLEQRELLMRYVR